MFIILDYGVGNLTSIQNMLKKAGMDAVISSNLHELDLATKLVLPGMGHFDNCMQKLNSSGLRSLVEKKAMVEKIPVLGICVGLQMFMEESEEGAEKGLAWVKGKTIRFQKERMNAIHKIPNMGWLDIQFCKSSLLENQLGDSRFYFAHSFHVSPKDDKSSLIKSTYGYEFTAAIEQENLIGVQFHPEKSHRFGMQLLKNFSFNY
ncbi:MAG: imidazole glycerol phosphate synthase subunit HisH [Chitinophagaceae bacterium]